MNLSIVSYLDEPTTNAVRKIQHDLSELTGSTASIVSWSPHITLADGITLEPNEIAGALQRFELTARQVKCFDVEVSGFGGINDWSPGHGDTATPYVLFLNVVVNESLLRAVGLLRKTIIDYPKWYSMPDPYLPHVTVAFRDLSREGYEFGTDYLSRINLQMTSRIDHIALVEKLPKIDTEFKRILLTD